MQLEDEKKKEEKKRRKRRTMIVGNKITMKRLTRNSSDRKGLSLQYQRSQSGIRTSPSDVGRPNSGSMVTQKGSKRRIELTPPDATLMRQAMAACGGGGGGSRHRRELSLAVCCSRA